MRRPGAKKRKHTVASERALQIYDDRDAKYGPELIDPEMLEVPVDSKLIFMRGGRGCLMPDGRWITQRQLGANRDRKAAEAHRAYEAAWHAKVHAGQERTVELGADDRVERDSDGFEIF